MTIRSRSYSQERPIHPHQAPARNCFETIFNCLSMRQRGDGCVCVCVCEGAAFTPKGQTVGTAKTVVLAAVRNGRYWACHLGGGNEKAAAAERDFRWIGRRPPPVRIE